MTSNPDNLGGTPVEPEEDSWTYLHRVADEVGLSASVGPMTADDARPLIKKRVG